MTPLRRNRNGWWVGEGVAPQTIPIRARCQRCRTEFRPTVRKQLDIYLIDCPTCTRGYAFETHPEDEDTSRWYSDRMLEVLEEEVVRRSMEKGKKYRIRYRLSTQKINRECVALFLWTSTRGEFVLSGRPEYGTSEIPNGSVLGWDEVPPDTKCYHSRKV